MMFPDGGTPEERAGIADQDLSETTVLVTGSTKGIGRAAATAFGRLGATVFVHGRDAEAGAAVVDDIEAAGGRAQFVQADFADPTAVSSLATTVKSAVSELDVLCNNAGGMFRDRQPTDLGVDRAFHINHLAAFQLTAELLDVLAYDARVVTTASVAHRGATLELDRLFDLSGLSPVAAYCRSKLSNILFSNELATRLAATGSDASVNAFHPGVIPGSEFGRALPGFSTDLWQLFENTPLTESVEDGAATLVYLGAAPTVADTSGAYFARCDEVRPAHAARDRENQRELWRCSAELLDMAQPLDKPATPPAVEASSD